MPTSTLRSRTRVRPASMPSALAKVMVIRGPRWLYVFHPSQPAIATAAIGSSQMGANRRCWTRASRTSVIRSSPPPRPT